ncbi:MAG: OBAP family protein [Pseudomonadota bacterium]
MAMLASAHCLAQQAVIPGQPKAPATAALEAGAKLLQTTTPLHPFDVYMVGFHPMKDHPDHQMEAHHYCHQVNEDFAQCTLFDGNGKGARLNGIEYIISDTLFETLPAAERQFWHPHNAEILSGQLVAPGIPAPAEKALMRQKMNSYGKTWHVWNTGHEGIAPDALPLGPAMLAWSFNRDGEAFPSMTERRDRRLGVDTSAIRRQRADMQKAAKPQAGVDALKGKFPRPTTDIPGVVARPR